MSKSVEFELDRIKCIRPVALDDVPAEVQKKVTEMFADGVRKALEKAMLDGMPEKVFEPICMSRDFGLMRSSMFVRDMMAFRVIPMEQIKYEVLD